MPTRTLALAALLFAAAASAQPKAAPIDMPPARTVTVGNQPIHDLAQTGTAAEMQAALAANPSLKNLRNVRGATPLHFAALNPDLGVLKALIGAGADVNLKDEDNATPLHMTAFSRKPEHTLALLEAGADVNATMTSGRTPRALAEKSRADEVAGVLSLWILKGCKPGSNCGIGVARDTKRLLK